MMHELLLAIQYIGIIGLFVESWLVIRRWKNQLHSYLLLSCLAALVNNIGYLLELKAQTQEAYITALQLSYAGRVWFAFLLFLFVAKLCHINLPEILKLILIVVNMVTYIVILTLQDHTLYYKNISFETDGMFPKMIHTNGVWHHFNMALQVVYIVLGLTWLFMAYHREKHQSARKRLFTVILSIVAQSTCFVVQISNMFAFTDSYDVTMLGYFIGTIFMFIAIFRYDLLGTSEIAREYMVDRLLEGIIAVDKEGTVQYVNEPAKKLYPELEVSSGTVPADIPDALVQGRNIIINERTYSVEENELIRGREHLGRLYALVDETEHYRYMQVLEEQKKLADSANQAKSAFLANMSHDIRTPINAVLGMNEMILRECADEHVIGYSEKIRSAGNTLLGLINDILDFSKIEAGN